MTDKTPKIDLLDADLAPTVPMVRPSQLPPVPALFRTAGTKAWERLLDYLVSTIRNRNTREAYARNISRFCGWCDQQGLSLETINPFVVAAYVEQSYCQMLWPGRF